MNYKKVLLGMSGGTDSSTAAMMLIQQGYEVVGVTFIFYQEGEEDNHHLKDAKTLAARLGIKHLVYDARDTFREQILSYFIDGYMSGITPVPCVKCNNMLKWPLLAKLADEMGIYHISTGHYVNTVVSEDGRIRISCGTDPDKGQSFFLWGLPVDILKRMLLPLGNITKSEVREFAAQEGYQSVAEKKDSLGICFCPGDYRDFLLKNIPEGSVREGFFFDESGKVIARHKGYPFYTVGQRRGLGLNLLQAVFVKEIIPSENKVIIAHGKDMYKDEFYIKDIHFNYPDEIKDAVLICKIRYRKQANECKITLLGGGTAKVSLLQPLNAIAPGQAAAFYSDNIVIRGGIII